MPVTSVVSDPDALTLTAVAEFPVPVARLWQAWQDPRQLERFWGPPQWPATFTRHDFQVGGRSEYHMTGPQGQTSRGFWEYLELDPGRSFAVRDGFSAADGTEDESLPGTTMRITFEPTETGSRFVAVSTFASLDALEQLVAMGMLEGMKAALGQLDDVLTDLRDHSRTLPAALEVVDETTVVVARVVHGALSQVWRAHHEQELVQQWMLGPDGWSMPVCQVAAAVGERFRYEWVDGTGENRFGLEGEMLEFEAPHRAVFTERMVGMDGSGTGNELTLTPRPGDKTLIQMTITYPSQEVRDIVLGTGMVDGMEASYARMEGVTRG